MTTQIHVGPAPLAFAATGELFDGASAALRPARLTLDETAACLVIAVDGQPDRHWPLAELRALPDQAGGDEVMLCHTGDRVTRLFVRDAETAHILATRAPNLARRPPQARRTPRLLAWAAAALASVALILWVLVPTMANQLAEYLPPEGERALGDQTFDQIRGALSENDFLPLRICETPAGSAALARMEARLTASLDLPYPVRTVVLDHDMLNAFALPGGRIVFFRGLIDAAGHPDEVASVFAHEIGHVVARDPTRIALRSAGSIGVLGLVFGDFAGGTLVLFLTERMIEATYSQAAEAAADSFAHTLLARAGIRPSAIGDMFRRFAEEGGAPPGILAHLASHPDLGDRIAAAAAADALIDGPVTASLTEADWQALRGICG